MKTIFFIFALIGFAVFVWSLLELRVYGSLYFDRDHYCIEKYRKVQKATDAVSFLHNGALCYMGFLMMATPLSRLFGTALPTRMLITAAFAALCLDALVIVAAIRRYQLADVRNSIKTQWKTQKHVTKDINHEVNMYRASVRLTIKYPREIAWTSAGLLAVIAMTLL